MAGVMSFAPQSNTIQLQTNGVASTANSTQISLANLGLTVTFPPQIWIVNAGGTNIFVSFTTATTTIALPSAGAGNGKLGWLLVPNVVQTFTLPTGQTLWVNDISTGTSIPYYFMLGEGM